jgi:hypothetical protein
MSEQTIRWPKCGCDIPLTETFTLQIEERLSRLFVGDHKTRRDMFESEPL